MMKALTLTSILLAGLTIQMAAAAQAPQGGSPANHIYSCKDASGHIIPSDRPIPECSDRTMEERSKGGMLLREIAPPLTPAQQRQAEADEKKRREIAEADREQKRRDQALLSSYSSEKDIEGARGRSIADYQEAIDKANDRLALLYADRSANQKEVAAYKGGPIPYALQRKIDLTDSGISAEQQTIADRKADIDRINHRFDTDLERFRVLTNNSASK